MVFARPLRERVRRGRITCSVRVWTRPHVRLGGRYPMDEGEIEVTRIDSISLDDVTPDLARRSGFETVDALWKVARHGSGSNVYVVHFRYHAAAFVGPRPTSRRS
jgi:hypothetical protein